MRWESVKRLAESHGILWPMNESMTIKRTWARTLNTPGQPASAVLTPAARSGSRSGAHRCPTTSGVSTGTNRLTNVCSNANNCAARLGGAVMNVIHVLELTLSVQAYHAQHRRHRSLPRRQDCAGEQHVDIFPDVLAESPFERSQHLYKAS